MQAYEGYVENGQFYPVGRVIYTHERRRAFVTVLDEPEKPLASDDGKLTAEQRTAAQNFLTAMQDLRKNGFTEEDEAAINDLQNGKYKPVFEERL